MSEVNSFLGSDLFILNNNLCYCVTDGELRIGRKERQLNQAYKE